MYKLYTDAGSRGNPGHAAAGAILLDSNDKLVDIQGKYLGIVPNNNAEYEGLIIGLRMALKYGCKDLTCYMDSQLVVRQIKGEYRVKDKNLKMKYNIVVEMMNKFSTISFVHVLREKNSYADKLVNIILDSI